MQLLFNLIHTVIKRFLEPFWSKGSYLHKHHGWKAGKEHISINSPPTTRFPPSNSKSGKTNTIFPCAKALKYRIFETHRVFINTDRRFLSSLCPQLAPFIDLLFATIFMEQQSQTAHRTL